MTACLRLKLIWIRSLSYSSAEQSATITWGAARKLGDIICNIKTTRALLCSLLRCVFAVTSQMFSTMCKPRERSYVAWGSRRESESDGSPQLFSAKPQRHVKFELICVAALCLFGWRFLFLYRHNAVLTLWLKSFGYSWEKKHWFGLRLVWLLPSALLACKKTPSPSPFHLPNVTVRQ